MDSIFVHLVTLTEAGQEMTITSLLLKASPVVKGVLMILVLMSIISWYIIIYKWLYLRRAQSESDLFLETFWQSKRLDEIYGTSEHLKRSPISQVFRAGYTELKKVKGGSATGDTLHGQMGDIENVDRALRRAQTSETMHLSSLVTFLATTASAAPFIGLFGTVWGIMASFLNIAKEQNADLLTVAPGIAEALIATAIGLVAAIPAVMAYNYFVSRISHLEADMDNFNNDFLNIVKRHFFS
ncbi:MAG: biopolymer transport protein TolQ [Bradymonadia bacterium]|jgi:biopolymer transport protein TolQ